MTGTDGTQFSPKDIANHRFEQRRKGYDTDAVDQFLVRVAQRIEALENELAAQGPDQAALDLLKNAERTARDTRLGAEIDANRIRETATSELDEARLERANLVEQGRAEAAQAVSDARSEAERIVTHARTEAAAVHRTALNQSAELEQKMVEVRKFIADSVSDLRLGAGRFTELADHFEAGLATRSGAIDAPGQGGATGPARPPEEDVIDLREPNPQAAPTDPRQLFPRTEPNP